MNKDVKILIVDDDPDLLYATTRIIKSEGYQLLNATSGAECKEIAGEYGPDLILLDVVLPDIDGSELCNELNLYKNFKDVFIILVSGMKTSSTEQVVGLDTDADGYIARPISNKELKARINAMTRILNAERERIIDELKKRLRISNG